jgi:Fe-S-cluster containining protein
LKNTTLLIQKVSELYHWIEEQTQNPELKIQNSCNACGNCCDFDAYGHRLYITPPELLYLAAMLSTLQPMTGSHCPYQIDNRCSIHEHRFASCRIFFCRGDKTQQSDLSEETLAKLKALCLEFDIPYRYMDLKTALSCSVEHP